MKIAIIDIESQIYNYLKTTQSSLENFTPISCKDNDNLSAIAKKVSENRYDAVLINIESTFEQANRSDLKGVELIYWLRLKENFLGTIITYGFLSAAQILRLKPEYVVIHAPGNYHLRLAEGLKNLEYTLNYSNNLTKANLKNIYRPFAEKLFNIHKSRHDKANWWAIKTMWDIENIRTGNKEPYPTPIKNKLKELNNFLAIEINKNKNFIRINDIVSQVILDHELIINDLQEKRRKLRKKRKQFDKEKKEQIEQIKNQIEENNELILLCKEEKF